ncbi:MAG: GNAT family N-acetyltransferase [Caldilineaceae bacterium]|nr:GNAT family N-acetyltransferase [Caldilineaceae bacterium]
MNILNALIRVANIEDLDGLARLNNLFNEGQETAGTIWQRLTNPSCVEIPIVAIIHNRVVGFAGLRIVPYLFYDGVHAELTELFVEESHRRQGIARALMQFAEQIARERNGHELVLHTGADNQTARKFYAAMGYTEWELVLGRTLLQE